MSKEVLEVVNDQDEVIGIESREKIHIEGLLHRETHVWFITPNKEIIFQHRSKDKDTYPDLLDATVGGHVEPGMNYEETAIKEAAEETGIKINSTELIVLEKFKIRSEDYKTHTINNAFRQQYGYVYKGNINDLKVEKGKAVGFELWPIEKILNLTAEDKNKFIPLVYSSDFLNLFKNLTS